MITLTDEEYQADLKEQQELGRAAGHYEAKRELHRVMSLLAWAAGGEIRVPRWMPVEMDGKAILTQFEDVDRNLVVRFKNQRSGHRRLT